MTQFANRFGDSAEGVAAYAAALVDTLGGREPLEVLRDMPRALAAAVSGIPDDLVGRAEAPGKWSVRQIVQHLADSELVGGFRFRMVLAHDRPAVPAYDQDAWAERLRYADSDVATALADFTTLRRANMRLVERATAAERARVGMHSERGEESLERMLQLYAGHDLVHLKQIARVRAAIGA